VITLSEVRCVDDHFLVLKLRLFSVKHAWLELSCFLPIIKELYGQKWAR
jgi:hypothetical protein